MNFSWICDRAKELQVPTIQIRILHKQFTVDQAMKEMMKYSLSPSEFAIGFSNLDLSFDPKRLVQLEEELQIAEEGTPKKKKKGGKGGKSSSNAMTISKFSVTDAELVGNSLQNTNKGVSTECPVTVQPSSTLSPINGEVLVSESVDSGEPLVAESLVGDKPSVTETSISHRTPVDNDQSLVDTSMNDEHQVSKTLVNDEQIVSDTLVNGEELVTDTSTNDSPLVTTSPVNEESLVAVSANNNEPSIRKTNDDAVVTECPVDDQPSVTESSVNGETLDTETLTNKEPLLFESSDNGFLKGAQGKQSDGSTINDRGTDSQLNKGAKISQCVKWNNSMIHDLIKSSELANQDKRTKKTYETKLHSQWAKLRPGYSHVSHRALCKALKNLKRKGRITDPESIHLLKEGQSSEMLDSKEPVSAHSTAEHPVDRSVLVALNDSETSVTQDKLVTDPLHSNETLVNDNSVGDRTDNEEIVSDIPRKISTLVSESSANNEELVSQPKGKGVDKVNEPVNDEMLVTEPSVNQDALVTVSQDNRGTLVNDTQVNSATSSDKSPVKSGMLVTENPVKKGTSASGTHSKTCRLLQKPSASTGATVTDTPVKKKHTKSSSAKKEPIINESLVAKTRMSCTTRTRSGIEVGEINAMFLHFMSLGSKSIKSKLGKTLARDIQDGNHGRGYYWLTDSTVHRLKPENTANTRKDVADSSSQIHLKKKKKAGKSVLEKGGQNIPKEVTPQSDDNLSQSKQPASVPSKKVLSVDYSHVELMFAKLAPLSTCSQSGDCKQRREAIFKLRLKLKEALVGPVLCEGGMSFNHVYYFIIKNTAILLV